MGPGPSLHGRELGRTYRRAPVDVTTLTLLQLRVLPGGTDVPRTRKTGARVTPPASLGLWGKDYYRPRPWGRRLLPGTTPCRDVLPCPLLPPRSSRPSFRFYEERWHTDTGPVSCLGGR